MDFISGNFIVGFVTITIRDKGQRKWMKFKNREQTWQEGLEMRLNKNGFNKMTIKYKAEILRKLNFT